MSKIEKIKFDEQVSKDLAYYSSQHQTKGCKVSHMIGVPMIVLSLFLFPVNVRTAWTMQIVGWLLQSVGHFYFEHNTPVILEIRRPSLLVAAVTFIAQRWKSFLSGRGI